MTIAAAFWSKKVDVKKPSLYRASLYITDDNNMRAN